MIIIQKHLEACGNIVNIHQQQIIIMQLLTLLRIILLIHLILKQKSPVKKEIMEQKMWK